MKTKIVTFLALAFLVLSTGAYAQTIVLRKGVIAAGGQSSSNGTTAMTATIGQPLTGASTNGQTQMQWGFWTTNAMIASSVRLATTAQDMKVYPNPTSGTSQLRLTMMQSAPVTVKLFDETGKEITTLFNGTLGAGAIALPMDLSTVPSGTYFIAVSSPNSLVQEPISVQR